jgi:hypothetical protein
LERRRVGDGGCGAGALAELGVVGALLRDLLNGGRFRAAQKGQQQEAPNGREERDAVHETVLRDGAIGRHLYDGAADASDWPAHYKPAREDTE